MVPTIASGSTVTIRGSSEIPAPGDVIAFWNGDNRVVVHRVVETRAVDGRLCCRTQGDHNAKDDGWVDMDVVIGRAEGVVATPKCGFLRRVFTRLRFPLTRIRQTRIGHLATSFSMTELEENTARENGRRQTSASQTERSSPRAAALPLDAVLRPAAKVQGRDLDGELLLCVEGSASVQVLNRTACEIYRLIDGTRTLGLITNDLATRCNKKPEEIAGDVAGLAARLLDSGILDLRDAPRKNGGGSGSP